MKLWVIPMLIGAVLMSTHFDATAAQMMGDGFEVPSSSLNGGGGATRNGQTHSVTLAGTSIGQASPVGLSGNTIGEVYSIPGFWQASGDAIALPCEGDCDGDGTVRITELIRGVGIALGSADVSQCPAMDSNGDSSVSVSELIKAVRNALDGCAAADALRARVSGSDAPGTMPIDLQGKLRGTEFLERSSVVDLELSVWDASSNGEMLFAERHQNTRLVNGVFHVLVGTGTAIQGDFSAHLFPGEERWLELRVDDEPLEPRQRVGAVAYAFRAEMVDRVPQADAVGGVQADDVVSAGGATFTGPVAVSGTNGMANARLAAVESYPDGGMVAVADAAGNELAAMSVDAAGEAWLRVRDPGGGTLAAIGSEEVEAGDGAGAILFGRRSGAVRTWGSNGTVNTRAGSELSSVDRGRVSAHDEQGESRAYMGIATEGNGVVVALGPNGLPNTLLVANSSSPDHGAVTVNDAEGASRILLRVTESGSGELETRGPNDTRNVRFFGTGEGSNNGAFSVYDERGEALVTAFSHTTGGIFSVLDIEGVARSLISGSGLVLTQGPNGNLNTRLGRRDDSVEEGLVAVADSAGNSRASLLIDPEARARGVVTASDGTDAAVLVVLNNGLGGIETNGPNGKDNVTLTSVGTNASNGFVNVSNAEGEGRSQLYAGSDGRGRLRLRESQGSERVAVRVAQGSTKIGLVQTFGANGDENVVLSARLGLVEGRNRGFASVRDADGEPAVQMTMSAYSGELRLEGPNGHRNVSVQSGIVVADASGSNRASLVPKVVSADIKNFVVPHPTLPHSKIVYASVEGPEAGIFHRGRVELRDGRGEVVLPEHFTALALAETITVQLTPASIGSRGVGFAALDGDRIEVGELKGGTGSYGVYFVVHALRRNHRDYQPVVDAEARRTEDEAREGRQQ